MKQGFIVLKTRLEELAKKVDTSNKQVIEYLSNPMYLAKVSVDYLHLRKEHDKIIRDINDSYSVEHNPERDELVKLYKPILGQIKTTDNLLIEQSKAIKASMTPSQLSQMNDWLKKHKVIQ